MREIHTNLGIQEFHFEYVLNVITEILIELGVDEVMRSEIKEAILVLKPDILCE